MSNIEKKGVGHLESKVAESKVLEPYFKDNDKTPSWDGNIFVYDPSIKKEFLKETIPVQIKSTEVKAFHSTTTSHDLGIIDIRNYYKIHGTILFVVEICEQERKIFIKSLLPSDLKEILAIMERDNHDNKRIYLDELENINQLEYICKHFILHKSLQFSTIEHSLSIEEASEVEIPIIPDGKPLEEFLFSKDHLLYGKKSNETISRYIKNINISSVNEKFAGSISVNSKIYYSIFNKIHNENNEIIFDFGKKIRINTTSGKLSFELIGSINEQIIDMSFLLDMIQVGMVDIGDGKLNISYVEGKELFIEKIKNNLKVLRDITNLLNYFHIDSSSLNTMFFENNDIMFLDVLLEIFIYNKPFDKVPFQLGFNAVKIGNLTLGIFAYKKDNEKIFTVIDLFDFNQINQLQFSATVPDKERFLTSPYIFLKKDFLLTVSNINLDAIFDSIKSIKFTDDYGTLVNDFGLELIKTSDISNRQEFLDTAIKIYCWLQTNQEDNLISKINELQIVRRIRFFSDKEKKELFEMRIQMQIDNNIRMLCGINILLENKSDVEICFEQLTLKEKKEFIQYPIFTLAKQFGMLGNIQNELK
jgi:hypothetical protein